MRVLSRPGASWIEVEIPKVKGSFAKLMRKPSTVLTGVFLGVLILVVSGCSGQPLTTREKGTLAGGVVGAGTGAIIGSAVGAPGVGAAIGGAIGAAGGALVGNELQNQQASNEQTQTKLQQQQQELQQQRLELDQGRQQRVE